MILSKKSTTFWDNALKVAKTEANHFVFAALPLSLSNMLCIVIKVKPS